MNNKLKILLVGLLVLVLAFLSAGIGSVKYVLINDNKRKSEFVNKVSVQSFDGLWLYSNIEKTDTENHKWVILIHSYRTDHNFMDSYANYYKEYGYNILQPDNRAHGESEGEYIGLGYLDQFDVLKWIEYVLSIDSEAEIVLHGVSMGAGTLMILSGQDSIPNNVKCIIEDCGYTSAEDYLSWKLKQRFGLPKYPIINIANLAFLLYAGFTAHQASALEGVKKSHLPVLFIHGSADQTVPVQDVYTLYESANCKKELYIVENAGHGDAMKKNPEKYWNTVFGFIDEID